LQEADIHAAFGREEEEEAEMDDDAAEAGSQAEESQGEQEAEQQPAGSDAEGEGDGEDIRSDEEREGSESGHSEAGSDADAEADVTVEYGEEGAPKSGKRKHRGKSGSPSKRTASSRRAAIADDDSEGEEGAPTSGGARARPKSTRASYPIGAGEAEEGEHDVTAEEGWEAAEAQRSHRRRTADLAAGTTGSPAAQRLQHRGAGDDDDEAAEEEGERDPLYDVDQDEDEEGEVQIRGRKRREAEEVVRARERRHELQTYYSQSKYPVTLLWLRGLVLCCGNVS
jgi:hypothetical protein